MRNILFLIISMFFLISCTSTKQVVIDTKKQDLKENKVVIESTNENNVFENKNEYILNNEQKEDKFKIAVVFPSKIVGKYGNSTINTVLGYMFFHNIDFEFESFDSVDESLDSVYSTFEKVEKKGYKKVIALFTKNSLSTINNISSINNMEIYFPLISKNDSLYSNSSNFYYGAISYEKQMKKLLEVSNGNNAQFYELSNIGFKLKGIYESLVNEVIVNQEIKQTNNNFKDIVTNESLLHSNIMLNTTIVKSSIILSQLYAYETNNGAVLTTQLNYNPLLISLTQYEDRLNLILANSIEDTNARLTEILTLLDSDVKYNWVNYSTLVGIDYLYSKNSFGLIKNKIENQEVLYDTYLYYSTKSNFKKLEL